MSNPRCSSRQPRLRAHGDGAAPLARVAPQEARADAQQLRRAREDHHREQPHQHAEPATRERRQPPTARDHQGQAQQRREERGPGPERHASHGAREHRRPRRGVASRQHGAGRENQEREARPIRAGGRAEEDGKGQERQQGHAHERPGRPEVRPQDEAQQADGHRPEHETGKGQREHLGGTSGRGQPGHRDIHRVAREVRSLGGQVEPMEGAREVHRVQVRQEPGQREQTRRHSGHPQQCDGASEGPGSHRPLPRFWRAICWVNDFESHSQ